MIESRNLDSMGALMEVLQRDDADAASETVIYHYTSLAGFISILKSNRIWATNFRFLNDPTEVEYGRQRLGEFFSRLVREGDSSLVPFASLLGAASDALNQQVLNKHLFIASFTALRDDLNHGG